MKSKILVLAIFSLVFFSVFSQKKTDATVHKIMGIAVFTDCEPQAEYVILGVVNSKMTMTGQYTDVRNNLLKKALKEYPNMEGLILSFTTGGTDRAVAIKFIDKTGTEPAH